MTTETLIEETAVDEKGVPLDPQPRRPGSAARLRLTCRGCGKSEIAVKSNGYAVYMPFYQAHRKGCEGLRRAKK